MALDMTPQEKAVGEANFQRVTGRLGLDRRQFMQGMIAAGAVLPISAAAYFGYNNQMFRERPVRAALIGAGDEGGVLVGEHNPAYLEFIAICDIRPSNYRERIWRGEERGPRKGLNYHYGNDAKKRIRHFLDYKEMLREMPDIEAVVIALPLHLHAPVAIYCMNQGKHVLCEKLMAWNIRQCKEMIRVADQKDVVLSIGHQRHYSMLYAHANEVIQTGVLGQIHHIRALWHRNNARPKPERERADRYDSFIDSWRKPIPEADRRALSDRDLQSAGYKDINELVRWRLYERTGGGLMAELGSHQLDACSIFLNKVRPLAVSAVGTKSFYREQYRGGQREVADHVFCTYEFPGKNYANDRDDVVVVTYSSISTNSFEPYGECVMGTNGTLVVEEEQRAMLWGMTGRSTAVSVNARAAGTPALTSSGTDGGADRTAQERGIESLGHAPPSRGYREEMEHFAYIIRMRERAGSERERRELKPRCDGRTALADAIMALTANKAMREQRRIVFQDRWYDPAAMGRDDFPDSDQVAAGPLPS